MNSKKSTVIIIGGAALGAEKVGWAMEMGLVSAVIDRDTGAPGLKNADIRIVADRDNQVEMVARSVDMLKEFDVRGVYCGIDLGITPTVLGHALGAPAIPLSAAATGNSKWLMKKIWLAKDIPTPYAVWCSTTEDGKVIAENLGYPLIAKISDSSGSRGVKKILAKEDFHRSIDHIREFSKERGFLLEEYIDGTMHDINGLFWKNKFHACGIMDRYFLPGSDCMSHSATDPTSLPPAKQGELYQLLDGAARAIGINMGPVKADMVWCKKGPMILEIAPRFHGDIQTMHTSGLGPEINALKAYFSAMVTGEVDETFLHPGNKWHAGWMSIPSRPGTFQSLSNVDEALKLEGVEKIITYMTPGKVLGTVTDNTQIPGVIIAKGKGIKQLNAVFNKALKIVQCKVS